MRLVLSLLTRNFSMEPAASPDIIKEIAAFVMMPSSMPVRLQALQRSEYPRSVGGRTFRLGWPPSRFVVAGPCNGDDSPPVSQAQATSMLRLQ
jgi:hypothetical protein